MFLKALTISTFALSSTAFAQDDMPPVENQSAPIDLEATTSVEITTDTDKELSLETVGEMTEEAFVTADADADGQLTQEEFVTMSVQIADETTVNAEPTASEFLIAKFEAIAEERATVTKAEVDQSVAADFAAADIDGDLTLKGAEIAEFKALRRGQSL